MKKTFFIAISLSTVLLAGCIKETFPTSYLTQEQLSQSENALEATARACAASLNRYTSNDYTDFGYPGIMIWRDQMGAEAPIYDTSMDYFAWIPSNTYLGDWMLQYCWWSFYYNLIHNSNILVSLVDPATASSTVLHYLGNALCYRAFAYFDLLRMYEFRATGYDELDNIAFNERGIKGLTVPIYTENTTEEISRNLPRAPFYELYRFILTDLNHAAEYLSGYSCSSVNEGDEAVANGFLARFWLEAASRFDSTISSDGEADLKEALSHEDDPELAHLDKLGITSANDCYRLAIEHAEKATAGHAPLTIDEWHDVTTGFNTAKSSWIFGMIIGTEDVSGSWKSFTGNMCPETTYGTANAEYDGYRLIDKALYETMPKSDWRRSTWIDPKDAGKLSKYSSYKTLLDEQTWMEAPAYANFKFRPGNGDMDNYLTGNVVDIPLMRVEEMYLIMAEAKAHLEGIASGAACLESFMNTYRYTDGSYACPASDMAAFNREILTQRRIEFWGEGIVIFDYRRLKIAVDRMYNGTNHPTSYQMKSNEGYVAPWSTLYITSKEYQYNHGLDGKHNPDPSNYCTTSSTNKD